MFRFRCAPIQEHELSKRLLSAQTLQSMAPSEWVRTYSDPSQGEPQVYLAEPYGGASMEEIVALCGEFQKVGKYAIIISTADYPFPPIAAFGCLLFEVMGPAAFSCTYGWDVSRYGPGRLGHWKPFSERKILASFVGSRGTHPVREILFSDIIKNYPDIVIENADWWTTISQPDGHEKSQHLAANFLEVLENSKFAFCPRGNGPSSKRRWESGYCGAVPILIDDATRPFDIDMPLPRFDPDSSKSIEENARGLLDLLLASVPGGDGLQHELGACLAEKFDPTEISPTHTTVGSIIATANLLWDPAKGFQCGTPA